MVTIFSTPKPFAGHIAVIQRNAIASWKRLHPDVEIVLVGDDAGSAEACAELDLRHIPTVAKNRHGTKYLASIYDQVQQAARHDLLCHVNCDIVLMPDFLRALKRVAREYSSFLMAGQRWDLDVTQPINLEDGWEARIRELAMAANRQRPPQWIDYFAFRKGMFAGVIPQFVIGRPGWDNWLLWHAMTIGTPAIDASRAVMAVHQNHDYSYHLDGEKGVWYGEEARENYRLGMEAGKYATLRQATYRMQGERFVRNYRRDLFVAWRKAVAGFYRVWFALLGATRGVRHRLGLRKRASAP